MFDEMIGDVGTLHAVDDDLQILHHRSALSVHRRIVGKPHAEPADAGIGRPNDSLERIARLSALIDMQVGTVEPES